MSDSATGEIILGSDPDIFFPQLLNQSFAPASRQSPVNNVRVHCRQINLRENFFLNNLFTCVCRCLWSLPDSLSYIYMYINIKYFYMPLGIIQKKNSCATVATSTWWYDVCVCVYVCVFTHSVHDLMSTRIYMHTYTHISPYDSIHTYAHKELFLFFIFCFYMPI